jgi:hypothetical protein
MDLFAAKKLQAAVIGPFKLVVGACEQAKQEV